MLTFRMYCRSSVISLDEFARQGSGQREEKNLRNRVCRRQRWGRLQQYTLPLLIICCQNQSTTITPVYCSCNRVYWFTEHTDDSTWIFWQTLVSPRCSDARANRPAATTTANWPFTTWREMMPPFGPPRPTKRSLMQSMD